MILKRISFGFLIAILLTLYSDGLFAYFIKVNLTDKNYSQGGVSGSAYEAGVGFFSFGKKNRYTFGVSYMDSVSMTTDGAGYIRLSKDLLNVRAQVGNLGKDNNKFSSAIAKVEGTNAFSAAYANIYYDIGEPRGLYTFGGLGYGKQTIVGKNLTDKADFLNAIAIIEVTSKKDREKKVEELVKNGKIKNQMLKFVNNQSALVDLLNQLFPNSGISGLVNSSDKVKNLTSDSTKMTAFLKQAKGLYDSVNYTTGSDMVCKAFTNCNSGVAYQVGIGYDYQIYKVIGADAFTRVYGIFGAPPIYSFGLNLSIVW